MIVVNLCIPGQFCAGLGDCIFWAWLAEGHPGEVSFFAKDGPAEMLRLFGQNVHDEPQNGMIDPSGAYTREQQDVGRLPRIHYVCRHLGIDVAASRPPIPPLEVDVNPKRIALCPHTNFVSRKWPAGYWLNLNWMLIDAGYEVIWQMAHDDPAFAGRGPSMSWWGGGFYDLARRLGSCAVVVGNDSMPAHLAGTIGRPTLALMGPTKKTVFSHIPEVKCLMSDAGCTGCHFGTPFRVGCDSLCESLGMLSTRTVLKEIRAIA